MMDGWIIDACIMDRWMVVDEEVNDRWMDGTMGGKYLLYNSNNFCHFVIECESLHLSLT